MSRVLTADQAAPGRRWIAVTPSDTVDLPAGCRSLFITVAGDVAAVGDDNHAETFTLTAGFWPLQARRVNTTGTTATGIKAIY